MKSVRTPKGGAVPHEPDRRVELLDTGFLRCLSSGSFSATMALDESDLFQVLAPTATPWRTPFSFMEWIGLKPRRLPRPEPFDLSQVSDGNYVEQAFRHYESHFEALPELRREHLEELATKQREQAGPHAIGIWDAMMAGFFGARDESGWLKFALAFDAVHKIEPPPDHRQAFHSDLVAAGFFRANRQIRNLSKFRLAYRMWLRTREIMSDSQASEDQRRCIAETHDLLKIDNREDYLDGDLVHVAALGVESHDGVRNRVTCFTCDKPEVVRMRIRLYKGLLKFVRAVYADEADAEGTPSDYEASHNGEVYCFDSSGRLMAHIDVSAETPPLDYLGDPSMIRNRP